MRQSIIDMSDYLQASFACFSVLKHCPRCLLNHNNQLTVTEAKSYTSSRISSCPLVITQSWYSRVTDAAASSLMMERQTKRTSVKVNHTPLFSHSQHTQTASHVAQLLASEHTCLTDTMEGGNFSP